MKKVLWLLLGFSGAAGAQGKLSFHEAFQKILDRHIDTAISREAWGRSKTATLAKELNFLPELSLVAERAYSRPTLPLITDSAGVSAGFNLFHSGADWAALLAARRDEDSAAATVENTLLTAEDEALSTLVGRIDERFELEVSAENVKTQADLASIAKKRFEQGLFALQETQKIEIDLDNAQAQLEDAKIRVSESSAKLGALLGDEDVADEWPWKELFLKSALVCPKVDTHDFEQRPDLRATRLKLEAESERRAVNARLLWPSLDLAATYGYARYDSRSGPGGTASLTLTIPLFTKAQNFTSYRGQVFAESQARLAVEKLERAAKSEWIAALTAYRSAVGTALAREKTIQSSQKLYSQSLGQFKGGRLNANDLAVDQARLNSARVLAVKGWASLHLAFGRLCHAGGRKLDDCLSQRGATLSCD